MRENDRENAGVRSSDALSSPAPCSCKREGGRCVDVYGGADPERVIGDAGGIMCSGMGLRDIAETFPPFVSFDSRKTSLIAAKSKPAWSGIVGVGSTSSPLPSAVSCLSKPFSVGGDEGPGDPVRSGNSSLGGRPSSVPSTSGTRDFLQYGVNEDADGGRETFCGGVTGFFFRPNHPLFCVASSSFTTIRSPLKSGSLNVLSVAVIRNRVWLSYLRFIKVVRRHGEAQLIHDQRHERSVAHVS